MKVLVLGGGVIGVTTAYYLNRLGHDVVVVERNDGVAEETSFQNGALLAPGHCHSWAAPGAFATLLKSLFQKDPALKLKFTLDPQFFRWSLRFLSHCNQRDFEANTLRTFRCMYEGMQEVRRLSRDAGVLFDEKPTGILYLFRTPESFSRRCNDWDLLRDQGLRLIRVSVDECIEIEPTLLDSRDSIGGGFFSPEESAGDTYLFTRNLSEYLVQRGVDFRFGTTLTGIEKSGSRVKCIYTDRGELDADAYVMALGPESPMAGRWIGLNLPIYPVKGYTVTIPSGVNHSAPGVGVIEEDNLVAFAHLGDRFRYGTGAVFAGYDRSYRDSDFSRLNRVAQNLFPDAGDYDSPRYWSCLRPVTAAGPPILGRSPVENLYLNVGHGAAGWTEACATSRAVAEIVDGQVPGLDMEGLAYVQ